VGGAQDLVAHAVKLAIVVILAGLFSTGRYRQCWSVTAYLVVALAGNCMISFWPERFYNYHFYTGRQAIFDVFKLLIALELSQKVFAAFPGAMSRWRVIALAVVVVTTGAVLLPAEADTATSVAYEWQPRIVAGSIWILCAIALLVAWHRLPIEGWHYAILAGYVPYLVVFTTILNLVPKRWSALAAFGIADSVAYLMLMVWWAAAAWRKVESPSAASERAARRLVLEPTA
jgi:hypothetical protein